MIIMVAEDIINVGSDGQTQEWPLAKFTTAELANAAKTTLEQEFKKVFRFLTYDEEQLPVDPDDLTLINSIIQDPAWISSGLEKLR